MYRCGKNSVCWLVCLFIQFGCETSFRREDEQTRRLELQVMPALELSKEGLMPALR